MPASRLLKERSISSSLGEVDRDVLAELLVSGLEAFEDGCELLSDDVIRRTAIGATGTGALCS